MSSGEPQARRVPAPALPVGRYRMRFAAAGRLAMGDRYLGSAWRGALGHALKKTVCVTRERDCPTCLLYRSCVYPYVFETPPPPDTGKMRCYPAAPHPFVLEPEPPRQGAGDGAGQMRLGLTLIGRACAHLPYFVHALARAGRDGVGPGRPALELVEVEQEDSPGSGRWSPIYRPPGPLEAAPPRPCAAPPPPPGALEITFLTPLRLKRDGRNVRPEAFRFADLLGSVLRRVSMLSYFHTEQPFETDFAALKERAAALELAGRELRWHDWTRYSSRQGTTMQMGGLVGRVRLEGGAADEFWPLLWLGQWVHAGRAASMGLGRYTIGPASLPATPRDPGARRL